MKNITEDDFNVNNIKLYTTEELVYYENLITEVWDRSWVVHSLTDLTEIVREITIRELENITSDGFLLSPE